MTKLITSESMNDLDLKNLRILLQQQHEEKRRFNDRRSEIGVSVSMIDANIHALRNRIARITAATPVQVSDHAILRYLQRVCGLDIDAVAAALDTPELRECIQKCPTGRHVINDVIYVTKDQLLVTIIYEARPPCIEPIPTIKDGAANAGPEAARTLSEEDLFDAAKLLACYRRDKEVKWIKQNGGAADYWVELMEKTREDLTKEAIDDITALLEKFELRRRG